ncbi:MAG: hypothetical protein ACFFBD_29320 [Candidatus Hodarchaeota archaeon]
MSKVAVIPTKPETILNDYSRLLDLINYQSFLDKGFKTIIKLNLSWSLYYPACSTTPWQLEGVVKKLLADGYKDLIGTENQSH